MKLKYMLAAGAILFSCTVSAQTAAGNRAYNSGGSSFRGGSMDQGAWPLPNAANIKKYRRAAEQGSAPAQLYVSMMYNSGYGVPQNHAEAVKWLLKAVEQDLAPAQNNLGGMYNSGLGVPPDYAEAAKWFRKAAVQKASFHGLRTSAIGHERKFEPRTLMEKLPK